MVCKIYIFIKSNILSYKNWRHSSYTIALSKGGIFDKNVVFLHKKMLISAKLREPWDWTVYFLSLHTCVHLSTKCQVFSIILTRFRQCGVILIEISDFGFDVQVWPFVMFAGSFCSFVGSLWSFVGGLWSFVDVCNRLQLVCGRLWSLPVLVVYLVVVVYYCIFHQKPLWSTSNYTIKNFFFHPSQNKISSNLYRARPSRKICRETWLILRL